MKQIECSICEETKPLHRKLSLVNANGELLDYVVYCVDCWNSIRKSIERVSELIDRNWD